MSDKKHKHHGQDEGQPPAEPLPAAPGPLEGDAAGEAPQGAEVLQAECADLLSRLQRLSADYLNYQKRVQRDMAQAREFANEDLMRVLVNVVDDMERALEAAKANHAADDPLLIGTQMVHDNLLGALGRFGLERIEAAGQPFDPELHAALMQQASADVPPGTVLQELQKGYRLKGRMIRPASVIVSQAPQAGESEQ